MLSPYPKGDIRYVDSIDEGVVDIKAVTREQMLKFHRDFFGAQPAQFAAVGDFDAAALEAQVTQLFGGWKAAKPFTARAERVLRCRGAGQDLPDARQGAGLLRRRAST